jgi:hypothetical protein
MEIYYGVLKDYSEADAEQMYSANAKYAVEFGDDDMKDAMKRRLALRGKKLNLY